MTVTDDTSPGAMTRSSPPATSIAIRRWGITAIMTIATRKPARRPGHPWPQATETPAPLNLFMNIPWEPQWRSVLERADEHAGDAITFRAEMDLVAGFLRLPMDLLPINGKDGVIRDAQVVLA